MCYLVTFYWRHHWLRNNKANRETLSCCFSSWLLNILFFYFTFYYKGNFMSLLHIGSLILNIWKVTIENDIHWLQKNWFPASCSNLKSRVSIECAHILKMVMSSLGKKNNCPYYRKCAQSWFIYFIYCFSNYHFWTWSHHLTDASGNNILRFITPSGNPVFLSVS